MKTVEDFKNGQLLAIDKPLKWTSFQVVNKLRWHIKKKFELKKIKVGHAGTLDPLASGLLLICTGKMTKQIQDFQAQVKPIREVLCWAVQLHPMIWKQRLISTSLQNIFQKN